MQLVSRLQYEAVYKPQGLLTIEPYDPEVYNHGHYYIRPGALRKNGAVLQIGSEIKIAGGGTTQIWSREVFNLSNRVLGLLGCTSKLFEKGLELQYSPFIDPGFRGALALSFRNNLNQEVILQPEEAIAKIYFFDISEAMFEVEEHMRNEVRRKDLQVREEAGNHIIDAFKKILG